MEQGAEQQEEGGVDKEVVVVVVDEAGVVGEHEDEEEDGRRLDTCKYNDSQRSSNALCYKATRLLYTAKSRSGPRRQ